jgi:hypothetical protein
MSESIPTESPNADQIAADQMKSSSTSRATDGTITYPGSAVALSRQVRPHRALKLEIVYDGIA